MQTRSVWSLQLSYARTASDGASHHHHQQQQQHKLSRLSSPDGLRTPSLPQKSANRRKGRRAAPATTSSSDSSTSGTPKPNHGRASQRAALRSVVKSAEITRTIDPAPTTQNSGPELYPQCLGREYETKAFTESYGPIIGVDEVLLCFSARTACRQGNNIPSLQVQAGRGPLAGPVVAAACVVPLDVLIPGVNDSKKLSAEQRDACFKLLVSHPQVRPSHTCVVAVAVL